MSKLKKYSAPELHNEVSRLYSQKAYSEMIQFEQAYLKLEIQNMDELQSLTEMFSRAYMILGQQDRKLALSRQYRIALKSLACGFDNSEIHNWKLNLEEAFFMRYVKVNKYILYFILLAVLLVNLDFVPSNSAYMPILTLTAVVWYIMNYVMNCRVKRLYLRLIRFIYS
ncbi:hypothetical protein EO244_04955 [Ancylomarina salipaludis]|uniref:Uncharacterized protein n=1 Tax=Ancylomarina salipaludis TaxID=2501299 RepID=A0A4Q1JND7_9BACT|nr:hypothetical protein [Ancylomarina salipaludis]RXQ96188.1 hypothetical protein EO244_04955 [Ancylomarina salipaludis]